MNHRRRFPVLHTDRLRLRELVPEDLDAVFDYVSLPDVARWTDLPPLSARSEAADLLDWMRRRFPDAEGLRWGIEERESGCLLGDVGFNTWDRESFSADIGYTLTPRAWGRGIATEAVAAVIRFGFEEFDEFRLNRIEAVTDPENAASRRVLEKLGFTFEGVLRAHRFEKGRFVDECCFSLLRGEFARRAPPAAGAGVGLAR